MSTGTVPSAGVLRHDATTGRVRYAVTGDLDLGDARAGADDAGGTAGADATSDVGRSRAVLAGALGVQPDRLLLPRQVHGTEVLVVEGPWPGEVPEADGLVVATPGTAVGVRAADCMPLLLGDGDLGLAGAVHVGRAGLQGDVVAVAVERLAWLGARSLLARFGPTVCGACYEVPEAMREEVALRVPTAAATTRQGTPSVDIAAGVRAQLAAAASACGVQIEIDDTWAACTMEDPSVYSHRRDAPTGRHAGVVVVLP